MKWQTKTKYDNMLVTPSVYTFSLLFMLLGLYYHNSAPTTAHCLFPAKEEEPTKIDREEARTGQRDLRQGVKS